MTGLRVGYGIADHKTIEVFSRVKMPWNVNHLAQAAAIAALSDKVHSEKTLEVMRAEKAYLGNELAKIEGFRVFPADTNFIFVDIRKSGFTAPKLKNALLSHGILVRDCSSFVGLDAFYLRVAVKTHLENMKLLHALRKVLQLGNTLPNK